MYENDMMKDELRSILRYLPVSPRDEAWGICCTTTGYQHVPPGERYPLERHPDSYNFVTDHGRVLDEYQLVYVTAGEGRFESASCPRTVVKAGTMIVLFPSEWHSYAPDPETGWTEWWVGFRGEQVDRLVRSGFFSPSRPLYPIGASAGIECCYREIVATVEAERTGFQLLASGIVQHMLGAVLFEHANRGSSDDPIVEKIDRAKTILRDHIGRDISPERIADELGMGYTRFRRAFREYVGVAPAQYRQVVRLNKARELLGATACSVSEIASRLGFESVSAFSLFFRSREGMSPNSYRKIYRGEGPVRREADERNGQRPEIE